VYLVLVVRRKKKPAAQGKEEENVGGNISGNRALLLGRYRLSLIGKPPHSGSTRPRRVGSEESYLNKISKVFIPFSGGESSVSNRILNNWLRRRI